LDEEKYVDLLQCQIGLGPIIYDSDSYLVVVGMKNDGKPLQWNGKGVVQVK
jgi:hypothetical protein